MREEFNNRFFQENRSSIQVYQCDVDTEQEDENYLSSNASIEEENSPDIGLSVQSSRKMLDQNIDSIQELKFYQNQEIIEEADEDS